MAERGGSDHALLRMVRVLAEDGWECHVVFPEPSPLAAAFEEAGAVLHTVPMRRLTRSGGPGYWAGYVLLWPATVLRLARLVIRLGIDVVHSNSLHSLYGWAAAALTRRPHVWHAREIVVQSDAALRLERWLARRFAARVLCVSGAVASQLRGPQVMVVHDALGPEDGFSPDRAGRFRDRLGLPDQVPLVGAAGRIDTWKGFEVLLEAVPALRQLRPDVEVVVAGNAVPGKEWYADQLAAAAGALPGVHWLGPREDMAELLADLDLFVLASTEPEPFAAVLVEAIASGVPVAATDHGGSPEMLSSLPPDRAALFAPRDPAALAAAVASLLPPGPSDADRRRRRRGRFVGDPAAFARVFDQVLAEARR